MPLLEGLILDFLLEMQVKISEKSNVVKDTRMCFTVLALHMRRTTMALVGVALSRSGDGWSAAVFTSAVFVSATVGTGGQGADGTGGARVELGVASSFSRPRSHRSWGPGGRSFCE